VIARRIVIAASLAGAVACTGRTGALTDLIEARRLAAEMHVEFMKAAEASNRAVMSDTDAASTAAAEQAAGSRKVVSRDQQALRQLIAKLGYGDDGAILEAFGTRFNTYQQLDDEILPLAVENTNLKAQRMSFVDARAAAAAVRSALSGDRSPASSAAQIGVLEILALQAPHIAEPGDEAMTRIEAEMAAAETDVRTALTELRRSLPKPQSDAATAAFDRFMAVNADIVKLSRRNSNVRSLALTLGKKQTITAECDSQLQALEHALAQHGFRATR